MSIKENAQLKMTQIIGKKFVLSGHIGEISITNFADGAKIVQFDSKDGLISLTLLTNEPFRMIFSKPSDKFTSCIGTVSEGEKK
jgi:hypothetical protein